MEIQGPATVPVDLLHIKVVHNCEDQVVHGFQSILLLKM